MIAGWKTVKLKDVCRVEKLQGAHANLPYVGLEDIEAGTGRLIGSKAPRSVKSNTFKFGSHHVLYGRLRPYLNKACIAGFDGHCSTEIFPIAVSERVLDSYLLHWLMKDSTVKSIDETSTGARMPRAQMDAVLEFYFPLAPLEEQKRIVAILDQAFEAIETGRANAEKNVLNAQRLFDSCLAESISQCDTAWSDTSLASACSLFFDSAHRTPKYQSEGIPALRPRDISNGTLNLSTAAYVSKHEYEIQTKRYKPQAGDIVYSRELTYGWAAVLPEQPLVCLSQGMCVFRPRDDVSTEFLLYLLNSDVVRAQAKAKAVGTAHPHINIGDIKAYKISLPALAKQRALAEKWSDLKDECLRLRAVIERKAGELEMLRDSLLDSAFTGAL